MNGEQLVQEMRQEGASGQAPEEEIAEETFPVEEGMVGPEEGGEEASESDDCEEDEEEHWLVDNPFEPLVESQADRNINPPLDPDEATYPSAAAVPAILYSADPCDPRRMTLTDQELLWARAVKKDMQQIPDVDAMSDFLYAQISLLDGDMDKALARAYKLQVFQKEYNIVQSVPHGQKVLRRFLDLFPGFLLSFSFYVETGNYLLVLDTARFYMDVLDTHKDAFDLYLQAMYYVFHAMTPEFSAVRQGAYSILECDGFDWKKNFGLSLLRPFWGELLTVYPIQFVQAKHYNTGFFLNTLVSMGRRFLPFDLHSKFEVGLTCELGRLDQLYLAPNLQVANERFMSRFTECLRRRYANEAAFKLHV